MVQRIQSVFMFLAIFSMIIVMYMYPVLILEDQEKMLSDFMIAQISVLIAMFLVLYSILQYKTRSKQLLLNQLSKLALSIAFFTIFIQKEQMLPDTGLFLFLLPYVFLILANRFIKKDDKLVDSADRIR